MVDRLFSIHPLDVALMDGRMNVIKPWAPAWLLVVDALQVIEIYLFTSLNGFVQDRTNNNYCAFL